MRLLEEMRLEVGLEECISFRHVQRNKGCILKVAPQAEISLHLV